jgi:hypothetical protein
MLESVRGKEFDSNQVKKQSHVRHNEEDDQRQMEMEQRVITQLSLLNSQIKNLLELFESKKVKRAFAQQIYGTLMFLEEQLALGSWAKMQTESNFTASTIHLRNITDCVDRMSKTVFAELDKNGFFASISANNDSVLLPRALAFDQMIAEQVIPAFAWLIRLNAIREFPTDQLLLKIDQNQTKCLD